MYYDDFDNKNKALEYFNKALIITQKYNDKRNTAISLHNIGSIHKDLGLYEVALKEEREALKFAQEINDYSQIAEIIGEISSISAENLTERCYNYCRICKKEDRRLSIYIFFGRDSRYCNTRSESIREISFC